MAKLTGFKKKIRTVIFISGTGSNAKNIIEFSKKKKKNLYKSIL